MPASRSLPVPILVGLTLITLGACTTSDGGSTATSTTARTTSTTAWDPPSTVPYDVPGLDCGSLADDGPPPPADRPPDQLPLRGAAIVLLTDGEGETSCLDLQLSDDPAEEQRFDPTAGRVDLRWADGRTLGLHLSVPEGAAVGSVEAELQIDEFGHSSRGSTADGCTVEFTELGDEGATGTITCDRLRSDDGGGPVRARVAFDVDD